MGPMSQIWKLPIKDIISSNTYEVKVPKGTKILSFGEDPENPQYVLWGMVPDIHEKEEERLTVFIIPTGQVVPAPAESARFLNTVITPSSFGPFVLHGFVKNN